jgi:TolA-binding protein
MKPAQGAHSLYVFRAAQAQDPSLGLKFRKRVGDWVDSMPRDAWTLEAKLQVANSFYRTKEFAGAARLYSILLQEGSWDVKGGSPQAREIVLNLASSLVEIGEREEATRMYETFHDLFQKSN